MKAYLLAAGTGSRLRPLTNVLPKPLVPFLNRPLVSAQHNNLLEHALHVRFNLSYLAGELIDYMQSVPRSSYCLEAQPLGSARTVWAERDYFDQTTIVACADVLADYDVERLIQQHRRTGALITIATVAVEDPRHFGVLASDEQGRIHTFQEKPAKPLSNTISTGIYVFSPEVFDYWDSTWKDLGSDAFPALVGAGLPVYACPLDCDWHDIGKLEDYLWVQLAQLGERNLVHPSAQIDPSARLQRTVIGVGAVVSADVQLSDCIVWPHTVVEAGTRSAMSVLTPQVPVTIGPRRLPAFARCHA